MSGRIKKNTHPKTFTALWCGQGFYKLNLLVWFDADCPGGFFAVSPLPSLPGTQSCVRCPPGTYKPRRGGSTPSACLACRADEVDHDGDPTTPCVLRPRFQVTRFARGGSTFAGGGTASIIQVARDVAMSIEPVHVLATVHNASHITLLQVCHREKER